MSFRRYYVYVVELRPLAGRAGRTKRGVPEVYVGSSAFPPGRKLSLHRSSAKGSRVVRKRGVRLLPHLFAGIGPFATREQAQAAERSLWARLRRQGYRVSGACNPARERACWL